MSWSCYNTLRVFPLMIAEDGDEQLKEFWSAFTQDDEGQKTFTFDKLVPEPPTGADGKWRTSNWGTTCIFEGTYHSGSEKQELVTRYDPPLEFFVRVAEKYPALVFFLECKIPEANCFSIGFFAGGQFVTGQKGKLWDLDSDDSDSRKTGTKTILLETEDR